MQCAVVNEWERLYPTLLFFAIPNGDYRTYRTGMRLKNEGVKPGVPDLCVAHAALKAHASSRYHGLYVELKQRGNRPNDTQLGLLMRLREEGYYACWCDSLEDAVHVLRAYMKGQL